MQEVEAEERPIVLFAFCYDLEKYQDLTEKILKFFKKSRLNSKFFVGGLCGCTKEVFMSIGKRDDLEDDFKRLIEKCKGFYDDEALNRVVLNAFEMLKPKMKYDESDKSAKQYLVIFHHQEVLDKSCKDLQDAIISNYAEFENLKILHFSIDESVNLCIQDLVNDCNGISKVIPKNNYKALLFILKRTLLAPLRI